jgi:2-polyprenyl-3-methyl-5-hydroxy-6-metoxy-1,4-benzoquinol methylase
MNGSSHNYLTTHPSLGRGSNSSKKLWLLELLTPVLPDRKDIRILEIGPGNGEALRLLTDDLGYTNVEAVDISAEVVEVCSLIEGVQVSLTTDTSAFLKDRVGIYDVVLMYHVLEHFPTELVVSTLSSIRAALSSNGILIVGVPNAAAPIIGNEQNYFDFTHRTGFSPWSLKQAHLMAGFERCEVSEVWPPQNGLARLLQRSVQKIVLSVVRGYLFLLVPHKRNVITHSMVSYAYKKAV